MMSKTIKCSSENNRISDIMNETEAFAEDQKLSQKQSLQMRLLAEELVGMIAEITTDFRGKFWIEGSDGSYDLCLEAETLVNRKKRDELIAVSSSGKDMYVKGIRGKIRGVFESFMLSYDEMDQRELMLTHSTPYSVGGMVDVSAYKSMETQIWSLQEYKTHIGDIRESEDQASEVWDELERSVVANLAEDVRVGIRGSKVTVIIHKSFS